MERITFLIESTHTRLTCLLNPEDREDSLTIQRSSGVSREDAGSLSRSGLTDNPVIARSRGDTRLTLKLLFDVDLTGSSIQATDVRKLTQPLWDLAEYVTDQRKSQSLPQVRLFWGKAWEIPAVVESVAERYERFTFEGIPQRSWLTISLLRVSDEVPPPVQPSATLATAMPAPQELAVEDPSWGAHEFIGGDLKGEALWQLAARYYGDPGLWRLIAIANQIEDPLRIAAGAILRIPPIQKLRGA